MSTYTFGDQTEQARWNPCEPIEYLVNADRATPAQITLMNRAIATVEQATALDFVFVGLTSAGLDLSVPAGSGADAVLVFSDASATPDLAGSVIGLGGSSSSAWIDDGTLWARRSSGGAMVDVDAGDSIQERVWMHEIGHMLGLDHVGDPSELMYFSLGSQPGFGPGDLEGLWNLGAAQPCIPDRPFGASSRSADLGGPGYDAPTGDADW
ncbi:matrixin family metalloprotease [Ilumatobacter sp.]|uniref:matrixin family metalloprotease n=1 Tax=Ilumatobacter sp. TaxID=1967498 RepID=UPI003AF88714